MFVIAKNWFEKLNDEFKRPYYENLTKFLEGEYKSKTIYPKPENVFNALNRVKYEDVKVVIIGQDPYHGEGQANGLCFSVNDGVAFPPSLRNIFKELESDLGIKAPTSGNLDRWAEQGVLLLNSTLTVRAHEAASHAGKGWEQFTDAVVATLSELKSGVVYMLWGAYAQRKGAAIDTERNLVLKCAHPSPLSAYNGFFGSRHFSKANAYLAAQGKEPIRW